MVNGSNLKYIYEFIEQKKGLKGISEFYYLINKNSVLVPKIENIQIDDEYSNGYLEKFLSASFEALSDTSLIFDLGKNYGLKFSKISLKLFSKIESNKKIMESIKEDIEKNMPLLKVNIEELSDKKFVMNIEKITTKEFDAFINGYLDSVFSKIQKKFIKVDENTNDRKIIVIKFM
ncbi:MAG: hypothetical protein ACP5JT_02010 [Thermoplasmata archaeon]